MSFNTAFARKAILGAAIVSLCPSLALADAFPATLLASGNVTIPESPSSPESITFEGVQLIAGQTYWVAVLPETPNTGASWMQNPDLGESVDGSGDGVTWSVNFWGSAAYPGEFDVIGSSSNFLYTDMAASPFATQHAWVIAGANAGYNAWASYFTPSATDSATQIDLVLTRNGTDDPNVTVNLYTSTENIAAVPEPGSVILLVTMLGAIAAPLKRRLGTR
jgi:hypothetical protein